MMRSSAYRWMLACSVALCLFTNARADSALDVSPACTTAVQTTTNDSLLSRGAFCQRSEPLEYVITDETNAQVGRVEIDAYAYSDNPLNRLEWPLKFRFRTRLVSGTAAGLQIKPIVECGDDCTVAPNAGVPLAIGGLSSEVVVILTPNMKGEKMLELRPYVEYKVAKTGDSFEDGPSVLPFYGKAHVPDIRCDIGLAKAKTRGCVYPDAPAIMRSVKTNDMAVDESAVHIRDAQAAGMPGKFISRGDGTIRESSDARPLTRLRDQEQRKKNRNASKDQCVVQYGKVNGQCTFTGDPDDEPSNCDCDEYPFAVTSQGASEKEFGKGFSVKRIDSGDNRRSGARLGCFLASQRVLDGEKFFVDVEPGDDIQGVPDICEQDVIDGND
ncbi:NucA/NucB deoxyribonuclease domain-containing protein [Trinickia acidisoli]|uniref:NucA/NucB deoxyribonuclease domain-containing protein n=1 Tax=Trinickia acidisoli TaxID=2767482 RepID=UPI001F5DD334|nr:NucA/NucB deoxyribonuclease domain-containing protein [Trinickia acidisoli]